VGLGYGRKWEPTNREVAETALSSEVFALGSSCDVVTSRKFVRFVGSAAQSDTPKTARDVNVENFIMKGTKMSVLLSKLENWIVITS
jgi:hypothetical protein